MHDPSLLWHIFLGRFEWDSLPFVKAWENPTVSELIAAGAAAIVILGAVISFGLITWLRAWRYLWTEWLTSLDHKKIGIMYIVFAVVMIARALIEAVLMRVQQAIAINAHGILAPDHFSQLFTTHGTIMVFFVGMPLLTGLINFAMPIQIGSRDVAFPFMNSVSLWLTIGGGGLMMVSLVIGEFSTGGWSGYPPYTELAFNGGVGPDYWIWAVTMSSLGAMMTGINFAVTVYKFRAPGMHWMRMPLFCWTSICTAVLMIFAMPPLTIATLLLAADRYLGMHFFTNGGGGDMMNYVNLFWLFGHPEVYILILPAFGVYSEVVSAFSSKELYSYVGLVIATVVIAFLSFTVWLHHFFTMGQSAAINAFFGIATMAIGIPTGVKIYNWIWTMFWGEVRYTAPMLFSIAFMVTFTIGGAAGIVLATPPLDYMMHNTLFLIAHFHNMLIPGLLYGMIAGYQYWFPKAFGFRLDEFWGRISVLFWVVGFYMAFMPLYVMGAAGVARRTDELFDPALRPWVIVAVLGAFLIFAGLACLFIQLWVSVKNRHRLMVPAGDPWDGRSLEWSIPCPAPEYNFATIPHVSRRDAYHWRKINGGAYKPADHYRDIEMPKNSMFGPVVGVATAISFFGLVWHIWWMAALFFILAIISGLARSFMRDLHKVIPAAQVEAADRRWLATAAAARPVPRTLELSPENEGLPQCQG
ncbi:MAG TPA: cbb3-type cytochrome c oxidase subunit I [Acidisoma sp.]|uniref:cbb3-type cytochrome c oxidase subunit I n=1 Tax=Acidisoma sp. TaxID=1872115 RepID=UPI002CFF9116|nr:cbb3-type cytochrome c oxidase subunit I [Acidisoma sp.]HTI00958.1 cbb3-type cytochrome c oxidase subunit I [Acidisoma sp.]